MHVYLAQETAPTMWQKISPWLQPMLDQFQEMGKSFATNFPNVLLGLVLFVIGIILAKIIRVVISKVGKKIQLDALADKLGISEMLSKFGIRSGLSHLVGTIVFWMLMLYFLKASAEIAGIKDIAKFVESLILFLPKVIVAVLILLAGMLAADLVRSVVETSLDNVGIDYSALIGKFLYGLFAVIVFTVVLNQLGIQAELINATVKIFLSGLSLAIALAMGLGMRTLTKNVISGVYARDLYTPGSIVKVDDKEGTVVEVGPVATRVEMGEGKFMVIPNARLVTECVEGKYRVSGFSEKKF